jgi:hypothetical protein
LRILAALARHRGFLSVSYLSIQGRRSLVTEYVVDHYITALPTRAVLLLLPGSREPFGDLLSTAFLPFVSSFTRLKILIGSCVDHSTYELSEAEYHLRLFRHKDTNTTERTHFCTYAADFLGCR